MVLFEDLLQISWKHQDKLAASSRFCSLTFSPSLSFEPEVLNSVFWVPLRVHIVLGFRFVTHLSTVINVWTMGITWCKRIRNRTLERKTYTGQDSSGTGLITFGLKKQKQEIRPKLNLSRVCCSYLIYSKRS